MPDYRRADDRPHHEIAADLGRVIPASHPDREHMPAVLRAGAALTSDQKDLVDALAAKHSAALQDLRGGSATEPFGDDTGIESAMAEAGVPHRGSGWRRQERVRQTIHEPPVMETALRELGIPMRD
jgi:hypothetical protein